MVALCFSNYNRHCAALTVVQNNEATRDTVFLVERTFSDIFAYTVLGMGAFNEYSDWLDNYKGLCVGAQTHYFDHIVFMTGREYRPEDDGVRSTNTDFSDTANFLIEKYTQEFTGGNDGVAHVSTIDVADLGERVAIMENIIHRLRTERG